MLSRHKRLGQVSSPSAPLLGVWSCCAWCFVGGSCTGRLHLLPPDIPPCLFVGLLACVCVPLAIVFRLRQRTRRRDDGVDIGTTWRSCLSLEIFGGVFSNCFHVVESLGVASVKNSVFSGFAVAWRSLQASDFMALKGLFQSFRRRFDLHCLARTAF